MQFVVGFRPIGDLVLTLGVRFTTGTWVIFGGGVSGVFRVITRTLQLDLDSTTSLCTFKPVIFYKGIYFEASIITPSDWFSIKHELFGLVEYLLGLSCLISNYQIFIAHYEFLV